MGRKAYFALPCVFLTVILTAGCVGQSSHTVSTAEGNAASQAARESGQEDSAASENVSEDPIGLEICGIPLSFPFSINDLGDDLLVRSSGLYSESNNYTLCDLSTASGIDICTVFVEGNEPDRKKSRIIGLIVDDMNDSISFRGLNDDPMDSYIEQYGNPNDESETLIAYTWGQINFLITFENLTQTADYVNLLLLEPDK